VGSDSTVSSAVAYAPTMNLRGTRRARLCHGLAASASIAAASALVARPARAADAGSGTAETALSVASIAVPPTTLLIWGFVNGDPKQDAHVAGGAFLIAGGGAGVVLGATAIGLQSTRPGSCDGDCRLTYGLSIAGIALGAAVTTLGIFRAAGRLPLRSPSTPSYLYLVPTPTLIPTPRGPVAGIGIGRVAF
jgi:hypothetical protein